MYLVHASLFTLSASLITSNQGHGPTGKNIYRKGINGTATVTDAGFNLVDNNGNGQVGPSGSTFLDLFTSETSAIITQPITQFVRTTLAPLNSVLSHVLVRGSEAINFIPSDSCSELSDQLHQVRHSGCDFGAIEWIDSDSDNWPDIQEKSCQANPLDNNSTPVDTDGNGVCNYLDADDDNDGFLDDNDEHPQDNTLAGDLDNDGQDSLIDTDDDGDGFSDAHEQACLSDSLLASSTPADNDLDFNPDCLDQDDDNDGFIDDLDHFPFDQWRAGDHDNDGQDSLLDSDDDNDGYSDKIEIAEGKNPLSRRNKPNDTDGDGLTNKQEDLNQNGKVDAGETHFNNRDSDSDTIPDKDELNLGRNPLKADYVISSGGFHSCAIGDNGLQCWGSNNYGQSTVPRLDHPVAVAAGQAHTCAIDNTGVVCWGAGKINIGESRNEGQSIAPTLNNPTAISAGTAHTCAINNNAVVCWGDNLYQQTEVPILINPRAIDTHGNHSCALDDFGVVCWGENRFGQTTVPPLNWPVAVSTGFWHTCALDRNGVTCWGQNTQGQTSVPSLSNPVAIAVGGTVSCALDDTGPVYWTCAAMSHPPEFTNLASFDVGSHHGCALDDNGVSCWEQATDVKVVIDSDLDGLPNSQEFKLATNPFDSDSDHDGVADGREHTQGTNPLHPDSDNEGLNDGIE